MCTKRYISDLHIGHSRAIFYDNRPFKSLDEMRQTIIDNWNSVVSDSDVTYVLGDMFWNNADIPEVLRQLKGEKHLILGNHDLPSSEMKKHFASIEAIKEVSDNGRHVILCHYPIAHWKNADRRSIHLYGHIHKGRDSRPFEEYVSLMKERGVPYECYNVGCMMPYMNYTPRTLDEIIEASKKEDLI